MGTLVLQAVVSGVLTGGVYALMAAGLTLIFGVMDIINVAQGILVVLGAYLSYVLSKYLGLDLFLGLVITVPVMFVIGALIEWLFISRLGERERTAMSILATYSVAIIIEGVLGLIFGTTYQQLNAWYVNQSFRVLGFYLPYIYVFGFVLALGLLSALYLMLYRTHFGSSVRATMQDRRAAQLLGVDVARVAAITFGIGVAVTAAGGMVFGATNSFNNNTGYDLISRLLSIVIFGGLGSIGGALVAAVVVLVAEDVVSVVWSPIWAPFVFFAMLIIVLSVKPSGLFGRAPARAQ